MPEIENLDVPALRKAFRRLKKGTRSFERLLVRDPTDFVDYEVQLSRQLEALKYDLESGRYVPQKPHLHASPKSKGINRPTVVFDVRDALVYRFCIEQVDGELIAKTRTNPNIRGGVKISPNIDAAEDGYYEKHFDDWMDHNNAIREGLAQRPVAASTDIASYFEGIDLSLLIDLVRSTVTGKAGVVSLLAFFLRNTRVQYDYSLSTSVGLPQEDIDCSRTLAYFYLHPHDNRVVSFAVENDSELFRFADDMTILVRSETQGREALKAVTDSLRELGLVASIEKTEIRSSEDVARELMYEENQELQELHDAIEAAVREGEVTAALLDSLRQLYLAWSQGEQSRRRSWSKVLKRLYTLATLSRADFLVDELERHLVEHPAEMQDKVTKYLVRIQSRTDISRIASNLLAYLGSRENLYPSLETTLLETFLYLDADLLSPDARNEIGSRARELALGEGKEPRSDYARGLGALLCYRFAPDAIDELARHYLDATIGSSILRKYSVFVALTSEDSALRTRVLAKARSEQDVSLNRLTGFVDGLPEAAAAGVVKTYLKRDQMYFLKSEVVEKYRPARQEVLSQLIALHPGA